MPTIVATGFGLPVVRIENRASSAVGIVVAVVDFDKPKPLGKRFQVQPGR